MNKMFSAIFAVLTLSHSAVAEDVESRVRRQVLAEMVAQQTLTDAAHRQFIDALATAMTVQLSSSFRTVSRVAASDPARVHEGLVSALGRSIETKDIKSALAHVLAEKFSQDELKVLLDFFSTEAGRKYLFVTSDEKFGTEFMDAVNVSTTLMDATAEELQRRFPKQSFEELKTGK